MLDKILLQQLLSCMLCNIIGANYMIIRKNLRSCNKAFNQHENMLSFLSLSEETSSIHTDTHTHTHTPPLSPHLSPLSPCFQCKIIIYYHTYDTNISLFLKHVCEELYGGVLIQFLAYSRAPVEVIELTICFMSANPCMPVTE